MASFFFTPNCHQCVLVLYNHLLLAAPRWLAGSLRGRKWPSASQFKGTWEREICFLRRAIWTRSLTRCVICGQSRPHKPHSDRAAGRMLKGQLKESSEVTDMRPCEWMRFQAPSAVEFDRTKSHLPAETGRFICGADCTPLLFCRQPLNVPNRSSHTVLPSV